jgi:hypothetical protein
MADPRVHLFANNASCRLGENVDVGELSITLENGKGALFPDPGSGEIFIFTITDLLDGRNEILYCTARSGDVLTVERGREGTTALEFIQSNNIIVQQRVTAGTLEYLSGASGVAGSVTIQLACSDLISDLVTGTNRAYVRAPKAFTLNEVRASLLEASSSGHVTVGINKNGASILYPDITIDQGEKTSESAVTAAIITDDDIADDDEITIDIITAGSGAKGLIVTLKGV